MKFQHRSNQELFELNTSVQLLFVAQQARELRAVRGTVPEYFALMKTSELLIGDLSEFTDGCGNELEGVDAAFDVAEKTHSLADVDRLVSAIFELVFHYEKMEGVE